MKKVLAIILMALAVTAVFVSCDDPKHEHSYSTEWKYDDTNHWHECECGEKKDVAAHTFEEWTLSEDGKIVVRTCDVCKYKEEEDYSDTSWYNETQTEGVFVLTNASQLRGLSQLVNDGNSFKDKTIKLDADIDLKNIKWIPIGLYDNPEGGEIATKRLFSGTFDGQGHAIKGLYFDNDKAETIALFGYVDGTVENFSVYGEIKAISGAGAVGALANGGTIANVINYVNVTCCENSNKGAGGIVYSNKIKGDKNPGWTIKNCKNYGNITAESCAYVGGIGGYWSTGSTDIIVVNCENYGTIKGKTAGGIVGEAGVFKITSCTNYGSVTATESAGGIVGHGGTTFTNDRAEFSICGNKGTVTGKSGQVGGIYGFHEGTTAIKGLDSCTTSGDLPKVGKDNANTST